MCGSGSTLALLSRGELSQVAVVVTLPIEQNSQNRIVWGRHSTGFANVHLVVEDLGLSRLGLGDQGLVKDVKDILADLLELGLDLLAVIADGGNVLLGSLGLLLLLDRGDDAPRGTSGTHDVLVGNGQKVALVDAELSTKLSHNMSADADPTWANPKTSRLSLIPWRPPSCM